MSVETAAQFIAEVSQRQEYQPTAESVEAIKDLTVNARVEALLITSRDIRIANLEVRTKHGEVQLFGLLVSSGLERLIVDEVKKVPGVLRVKTYFVVTPPEHYMYGDGR
jgi:osmotically-inducible protein OsmY